MAPGGNTTTAVKRKRIEARFRSSLASIAIPEGSLLLVATSGGPDSSALLLLLERFARPGGYRLAAAHFDHELRPDVERAEELEAVRSLTRLLGVRLHEGSAPVRALARQHRRSLEEEARIQRYGFLARVASACGAVAVVVGHTSDDQAETTLLHLLRGSGLRGLVGMAANGRWPVGSGPPLLRPLLLLSREDTHDYCRLRGVEPYHDPSNLAPQHSRNRIRHELMPMLRSFNPAVDRAIVRLGHAAAEQLALLDALARAVPAAEESAGGTPAGIRLDMLRNVPAGLRHELLVRAYAQIAGGREGLTALHRSALEALVIAGDERRVDLPRRVVAQVSAGTLTFQRGPGVEGVSAVTPLRETPLLIPGITRIGCWELTATIAGPEVQVARRPLSAALPVSHGAALTVRARRPGDRMRPAGLERSKKLQDIFVDVKIPRWERDQVPLVCAGDEIVWVVGLRRSRLADRFGEGMSRIALTAACLDASRASRLGYE